MPDYRLLPDGQKAVVEEVSGDCVVPHFYVSNMGVVQQVHAILEDHGTLLADIRTALNTILLLTPNRASSAGRVNVAVTNVSRQLLGPNPARLWAGFVNLSGTVYIALGTTPASDTSYTVKLAAGDSWALPAGYWGAVQVIRASGSGYVTVTELT